MLNPESVDFITDRPDLLQNPTVEILFTDQEANPACTVQVSSKDAMKLAHMIMDQCSYKAQKKRKP